jgi:exopolysaccharide biosynthesis protein
MTDNDGTEVILSRCRKVCKKVYVREKTGDSAIPRDGFVISIASNEMTPGSLLEKLKVEEKKRSAAVEISTTLFEKDRPNVKRSAVPEDITNGVPILIREGKIDVTWQQEKSSRSFVETRHPRTAVAKLKDGRFLMITIDGRTEASGGIGLYDLAAYLLELGATDAMNLDGGGSTTMFLDGRVVNHPSDKEGERKVSDAILVTLRKGARRAK